MTEESSLVLETLEEGRHHHYLIPIQVNIVCWWFQNLWILNFESKYLTDLCFYTYMSSIPLLSFSIFCTFQHHVFLGHLLSFNWVIFHISSFTFLQAARRGRFKKKGTKLHIFMDHIFVARHIKLWDHFLWNMILENWMDFNKRKWKLNVIWNDELKVTCCYSKGERLSSLQCPHSTTAGKTGLCLQVRKPSLIY